MAWIIVALLFYSTVSIAQPFGPFLVAQGNESSTIGEAKVVVDAEGNAHVFYERDDSGARYVMYTVLEASSGAVIAEPVAVYFALTEFLFLEDAALTESGVPKILVFTADPNDYRLYLVQPTGNDWADLLLFQDHDGWSPEYGQLSHWLERCRFAAVNDEYTQAVLYKTGIAGGGGFLEPFASPVVCFANSTGIVSSFSLGFGGQVALGTLRCSSLGNDSLYLWAEGYSIGFGKYVVRRDSTWDEVATYDYNDCLYGELAGMPLNSGADIHVNNTALCIPTCLTFVRFDNDSCSVIGETYVFPPMYSPTTSAEYEEHGFVFPIRDENEVQLLRVDTLANIAAPIGTIGWRDGVVQITNASCGVSVDGAIAAVWRDFDPATSVQRLWLASCDWLTLLESRAAPAPLPEEFSLAAYPNPFNSAVRIDYDLTRAEDVRVSIFNTLGQEIETLLHERVQAGAHSLSWSAKGASGVYFIRLAAGEVVTSTKVLYLR